MLRFLPEAKKEFDRLDSDLKKVFFKKLVKVLEEPRIEKSKLCGIKGCYKIKLRASGYRLAYKVDEEDREVTVVAVGRRDDSEVYKSARKRI